jgi:hypothetical protein
MALFCFFVVYQNYFTVFDKKNIFFDYFWAFKAVFEAFICLY